MKAVIPAAGLGTRMLPATKSMPKEMLPVLDKPVIQYVVEEAVAAGADEVLIVTGRGKRAIEDHFDRNVELDHHLAAHGKPSPELRALDELSDLARIHYVRQSEPLGLGHAVLCAKKFVGDEPFAVLLGDDILFADPVPTKALMDAHAQLGKSVFTAMRVPMERMHLYGAVVTREQKGLPKGIVAAADIVEKPAAGTSPSNLAAMGRYVFGPEVFRYLEGVQPGKGGEIQLADAMAAMSKRRALFAVEFSGVRLDVGSWEGFIEANLRLALDRPGLSSAVRKTMERLLAQQAPLELPGWGTQATVPARISSRTGKATPAKPGKANPTTAASRGGKS